MTIDERLQELMDSPWMNGRSDLITQRRAERVRDALLEVARDQRQASRDAADAIDQNLFNKRRVSEAIMNATIK